MQNLRRRFVLSLVLGVAVVLGLALYGNAASLGSALSRFNWALLPLILGLTLGNYALRFVKWHYYLGQIGSRPNYGDSLAIFSSGLSMAMTPGKVGEVLKPYLLMLRTGAPMSRSIPVVMAERLTDGIAMILLAFAGLLLWHRAWQVLLASVALAAVAVGLLGSDRGSQAVRRLASQLPYLSRQASHVDSFLASSRTLYTPRNLAIAVGIGVVSWSGEALAFYLVLTGLGIHASWTLLIQATFILCISTLVGSLSLLPGGLGAADFSVAGLLQLVAQLSRLKATAATLLIRFCTLWFGVSLGLLALFLFRGRFHSPQVSAAEIEALQAAPR